MAVQTSSEATVGEDARRLLHSSEAVAQVGDHGRLLWGSPTSRRCEGIADVDSAHSRGGRRHARELVVDFSNALDLCDSLTRLRASIEARLDGHSHLGRGSGGTTWALARRCGSKLTADWPAR
jgi:hypothetical protein